jgi:hypothetical protein
VTHEIRGCARRRRAGVFRTEDAEAAGRALGDPVGDVR